MVYLVARRNRDRDALFGQLQEYRDEIGGEFEERLEWRPPDGKHKLIVRRTADVENNRAEWDAYQNWLIDRAERLYFAIAPYLTDFDPQ